MPAPQIQQNNIIPNPSPNWTSVSVGSGSPVPAIGASSVRRGIIFANPGTVALFLAPAGTALAAGQGLPLFPGAMITLLADGNIQYNCAWQAIAASASGNVLTVLELV